MPEASDNPTSAREVYSPSALTRFVRDLLEDVLPLIWIGPASLSTVQVLASEKLAQPDSTLTFARFSRRSENETVLSRSPTRKSRTPLTSWPIRHLDRQGEGRRIDQSPAFYMISREM